MMPCADFSFGTSTYAAPQNCCEGRLSHLLTSGAALVFISPLISRGVEFHDFLIEKTVGARLQLPHACDFHCPSVIHILLMT